MVLLSSYVTWVLSSLVLNMLSHLLFLVEGLLDAASNYFGIVAAMSSSFFTLVTLHLYFVVLKIFVCVCLVQTAGFTGVQ